MSSDNDSGSGRSSKVFRDVMRRITPAGTAGEPVGPQGSDSPDVGSTEHLQDAFRAFGSDSAEFKRRLERLLSEFETLRGRYETVRESHEQAARQNEKLVALLQEAKQQIELLKEEVAPNGSTIIPAMGR